ncbi:uncharacterized protein [Porites lutea]|uniref:uncharacterized protein isoform X1 n=1 Tax=Porites lutea TaxID=51062 RepID=UPI003CC644C4
MCSKSGAVCLNSGTVLSVFCLLLYSAGFIRIELKFDDHEARLLAVEDVISQMHSRNQRFMMDDTSIQGNVTMKDFKKKEGNRKMVLHRFTRQVTSNKPFENSTKIRLILEDVVTSSFKKICQNTGTWNVCPRGLPGPPGRDGAKGNKGDRGRRGKKGMMGQPGISGKQGIMGPPGVRGEKGVKGDIGASGIPGMKGEQGESISAPKVTVSSSHLTVNESNTAVLLCSVSGNPVPQVAWSRVGGVLPSNRTKVSSEGLLQINEVRLEDAGNYKCEARNIFGREEKLASLAVQSQPKTSLSFGPSYVVKGKNITLPACHVTGYPSPKISWYKVPGNLVQARTVMKDGRLSIMNAYKSDSGLYKCEASNNLGHDSAVTQLNVVELPHFTVSPPSQLNVSTVQNITVSCQAAGDPQPTIMWRKEGGKLPAGRSSASADGTLKIWNLREREDSGRYTCVASSNQFFKAFSVMDVIIVQHKGICPNNWIRLKGSCYKVSSGSTNWNAAKSACEAMGSKLAILTSQAEQQALASKISQDVWIGLHRDPNDNSRWMWVDGSRTTYTHWSNREPNDHGGNEDCTYMFPPAGKWNDSPCSHGRQYLCETKGR